MIWWYWLIFRSRIRVKISGLLVVQILTFSSLYPNNVDPSHGIFVERRLRELVAHTDIRSTVISPVPWFPFRAGIFGDYAGMAAISRRDQRFGIDVLHPRFPLIPKLGMNAAAGLMASACRRPVRSCVKALGVALIDAHYFYPDGVAASRLARELGLPYCITARGSDINLIGNFKSPGKQMLRAAEGASALIAVSEALACAMRDLGMPAEKIHVLRNGVDLDFFAPDSSDHSGKRLAPGGPVFLSVGALKPAKGHGIAIRFIQQLPDARLVVIGKGTGEAGLQQLASQLGVGDRVTFTGTLAPEALRSWYRAADALILMSEREGMPNVILESLACGTPVLATDVGGIPELITDSCCGELIPSRSADDLATAWQRLLRRGIEPKRIRQLAMRFSWHDSTEKLHALMTEIVTARQFER